MAEPARESNTLSERAKLSGAERRSDPRFALTLRVSTASVDAIPDARSGQGWYASSDRDAATNVSRRGVCLACERPPAIGTRMLLEIFVPGEARPLDLVGCARWTSVVYEYGRTGARPVASVGVEIVGGSPSALDRYERALALLSAPFGDSVATPGSLR